MSPEDFKRLADQGYNRIPVTREVLADLDTPLSCYLKLANQPYSYLLESVQGGEKWGRYSIIGLSCSNVLRVQGSQITLTQKGKVVESCQTEDPLAYITGFQARFKVPDLPNLPRFNGGLVGYFSYDSVRYIEPKLQGHAPADPLGTPDILLMVSDKVIVFDNLSGKLMLVHHVDPGESNALANAQLELDRLVRELRSGEKPRFPDQRAPQQVRESDFVSGFTQAAFEAAVDKIKSYVLAGDIMQTVISQRMSIPFQASPLDLYRSLRCLNPSPYMYYLNLEDFYIVGSSPEILARVEDNKVTVRPIAGTRRRGKTEAEDLAMEAELLNDPKEIAEHLMLIDLGRNDAGRVSKIGTVKVTDQMVVERYSHVMHIVSNVQGELKPGMNAMDVLRATFPAGTLSGAPKIRAMEIIDELEPVKRGIYGGAIGYLSWNGNMDTAIAIRTAVIKDGQLHIQAGAGVVADSIPALEWKETMNKGRAVFRAVAMASQGLDCLDKNEA
jgi:anthranilate synthase component 1